MRFRLQTLAALLSVPLALCLAPHAYALRADALPGRTQTVTQLKTNDRIRARLQRRLDTTASSSSAPSRRVILRPHSTTSGAIIEMRAEVVRLVNVERAKVGLKPLTRNPLLEQAAQAHADDMFTREYFDHVSPDGSTFAQRIRATGYAKTPTCRCRVRASMGENIAKGFTDAASVMKAWMASEGHKENILDDGYEEIGVGIVQGIWAQEFGRFQVEPLR